MKLGFVESLKQIGEKSTKHDWKKFIRSVDKRTTVIENPYLQQKNINVQKRQSYQDYFSQFTKQILPKFEEKVEIDYLKKQFKDIKNEQIQNDLINAYIKRRVKLYSIDAEDIEEMSQEKQLLNEHKENTYSPLAQVGLNDLGEQDIGKYVQFQLSDFNKYFKDGEFFGRYSEKELHWTKSFSLMANEESLKIVDYLNFIKQTLKKSNKNLINLQQNSENIMNDEEMYFEVYRVFSKNLLQSLQNYRNDLLMERYMATPNIFDFLVRIVIQQINKSEILAQDLQDENLRQAVFDQLLKQVQAKGDPEQSNSQFLVEFLRTMQEFEIQLSNNETLKIDLLDKQLIKNKRKIPESLKHLNQFTGFNSGLMLYGDRGTGKSGTLGYVTMWAHKNDFVVVNVPSAYKLTNSQTIIFRHQKTGLYLQNDLAKEWLEYFLHGNQHLLEKIKINQEIYGKYGYSGIHDNDPEAVPNTYYERRNAYFEDHKQFLYEEEIKLNEELDKKMETRVSEKLPEPKTLKELVQYGVDNEWFACNVVYEVLEQLYNVDSHCVLVVVDEFNYLYKESIYPSFRYANDKDLNNCIPPYHLSLCRAFVNMDGHKIKNGFKLVASSVEKLQRHKFEPQNINLPHGYAYELDGLKLDDFRNMCQYYLKSGLWRTDEAGENSVDFLYMQTQGNWQQAQKYMIEHYVDAYFTR